MSITEIDRAKAKLAELRKQEYAAKDNAKTFERQFIYERRKARRLTIERRKLEKHLKYLPKKTKAKLYQDRLYVKYNFGRVIEMFERI